MAKYSDELASWLIDEGYQTCFFVAGGNIMHLIESFSKKFEMIPVVHEVAAVIAADYYNEASSAGSYSPRGKALALVTVGPGVTNTVTAVAGAFVDGRELILIGGQVKSSDLKQSDERQRGIQEVDGVEILKSITKASMRLDQRITEAHFKKIVAASGQNRKGPVYFEVCLDVQGSEASSLDNDLEAPDSGVLPKPPLSNVYEVCESDLTSYLKSSLRPLILVGGGVSRSQKTLIKDIKKLGIPIATTWHGADRIPSDDELYAGRPNLFGQRWANIILQQADLLISLGSSLGLQQTGFNLQEFAPMARILQVDVDMTSMKSAYKPSIVPVHMSVENFVGKMLSLEQLPDIQSSRSWANWKDFVVRVRGEIPLVEPVTYSDDQSINPFHFLEVLSGIAPRNLNFIPCSSGGSYTASMQVFQQKQGQTIVSSRGLGSMGIGLSGAIGASLGNNQLTWLVEGDGGILQNIQEIGTIVKQALPIKVIVFNNDGYASIRSTQEKYFAGNYLGCDSKTGLGLPNFEMLAKSYGMRYSSIQKMKEVPASVPFLLDDKCHFLEVSIPRDQVFAPKIESRLAADGSMSSNPLHVMHPLLASEVEKSVLPWLEGRNNE